MNTIYAKAEGQNDGTLCWAACMAWWTRATNRADRSQTWVQEEFTHFWSDANGMTNKGTIGDASMWELISYPLWRMYGERVYTSSNLTPALLQRYLNYGPVYIGFYDAGISSPHVNVIYKMKGNGSNPQVWAMEPRYSAKNDGTDNFEGKHVIRNFSHYTSPGCTIFLGSPQP